MTQPNQTYVQSRRTCKHVAIERARPYHGSPVVKCPTCGKRWFADDPGRPKTQTFTIEIEPEVFEQRLARKVRDCEVDGHSDPDNTGLCIYCGCILDD